MRGQRAEGKGQRSEVRASDCVLCALLITLVVPAVASAQQMVIFVRHAERADGGPARAR